MARTEYTVNAYSKKLNQSIREFNLEMNNPQLTNPKYAQQIADAFAIRLNQRAHMQATDWVGKIKLETVGIETLPQYQFHTGN